MLFKNIKISDILCKLALWRGPIWNEMLIESFIFFLNILMGGNDGTASSISDLSVMTSPLSANLRVNISPDPNDQQNAEVIPYNSLVMDILLAMDISLF